MRSSERFLAIVVAVITIAGAYQSIAVLPYRVEQTEKSQREAAEKIAIEIREVRAQAEVEKQKSDLVRESLIRIEERVKGVQTAVDEMSKRQRTN